MNNKLIQNLKQDIVNFEQNIFGNKVLLSYPILPIQLISILANYKSRILKIKFDTYIEIGRLEQVILQLIRNNDLFRSSIISRGGKLFVQEHEPPEKVKLPMIDFSYKDDQTREKIIKKIFQSKPLKKLGTKQFFIQFLAYKNLFLVLSHLYPKNNKYKIIKNLLSIPIFNEYNPSRKYGLCKFILVKKNIKEYTLMLYLDHLLLDDISIGHIIEKIENSYYSDTYVNNKPLSYSSLATQLGMGPKINAPDVIIDKLKLKDYFSSSQKIKNESNYSHHYLFSYHAVIRDIYHNELIEVAILISAIICSKIFRVNKVPITLLSGNRKYQTVNYYDTIGLFQDFVPLIIDLEGMNGVLKKNHINDYLNFLSANNIHVMYILFNKYNDENWKNFIELVNPEKIIGAEPVITLNIEFDQGGNDDINNESVSQTLTGNNQISIVKTRDKALIKNLKRRGEIILWVNISKNSISFKIESLFPVEEQYFNTFTKEIHEFIE